MSQSELVRGNRVHVRLLVTIGLLDKFQKAGIAVGGFTTVDILDLAELVLPDESFGWTGCQVQAPRLLQPEILKQHPKIAKLSLKGVTDATIEEWFKGVARQLEGDYLPMKAVEVSAP